MFNAHPLSPPVDRLETIAALRAAVASNMAVTGYTFDDNGVIHLHGRLLSAPEIAYRPMRANVERLGYTPFLKESKDHAGMYELDVIPGVASRSKPDVRVNFWLYIATLVSVVFSYAYYTNPNAPDINSGVMFGLTLITILSATRWDTMWWASCAAHLSPCPISCPCRSFRLSAPWAR